MPAVSNVLVVGGGTAGCAVATLLARGGVAVEIAEIRSDWTSHGSGITLQGNALRVLREVGVWPEVSESGYAFSSVGIRSASGRLLVELPDARTGGPDLPGTLGMNRPRLAEVLSGAAWRAGAKIRLGVTVRSLSQDGAGVDVTFTDGTTAHYDLVIGADGIRSPLRSMLGIDLQPRPTGLSIWRVAARRPATVERTDLVYDGPCYIAGYCPTSEHTLYAYLVEASQDRISLPPAQQLELVRELAAGYGGAWQEIRADLTDPGRINYTAFESLLLAEPWHRGRVVLIGDAVHACPPTLAQGAAMCLEDASVLARLLLEGARLDPELLSAFAWRRYDRVSEVVEASVQLAQWLLDRVTDADVPGLMGRIAALVSEPA